MSPIRALISALCFALAGFGGGAVASAHYSLTLEDEYGHELPTYQHGGERWVMGRYGQRYNLRIRNHTGRRVEVVVTVDGRDVVTGKRGDFKNARGYVIDAYDSVVIDGFRKSLSSVAAFRFTDPGDSYSSRMGTPENVGVIGAAFFPERRHRRPRKPIARPRPYYDYRGDLDGAPSESRSAPSTRAGRRKRSGGGGAASGGAPAPRSAPAPEAFADAERESNLGTRYGEDRSSAAREVRFRRANRRRPATVLTARYDDREGLLARGVIAPPRPWRHAHRHQPEPFPDSRFAPPPPRY